MCFTITQDMMAMYGRGGGGRGHGLVCMKLYDVKSVYGRVLFAWTILLIDQ